MTPFTRRFLISFIVAEVFQVYLRGVCWDIFEEILVLSPEPELESCGLNMKCVEPHVCINGEINTKGEHILIIRSAKDGCSGGKVCCRDTSEENMDSEEVGQTKDGCGYLNKGGIDPPPRRISGHAEFGEVPWALMVLSNDNSEAYFGGASLINPKIALTAAHIVDGEPTHKMKVRAGEWTPRHRNESRTHQDRPVLESVIHEKFNRRTLFNDIALLFLKYAFEMKPHINTVCLPSSDLQQRRSACFATGWGVSAKYNLNATFEYLKKSSLYAVPNSICQRLLRRAHASAFFELHESFMCAGGAGDEDMCFHDDGSPLVCPIPGSEDRFQQVGVVSWGMEGVCGGKNVPGVYADVEHLRRWVDAKVASRELSTSTYTADWLK